MSKTMNNEKTNNEPNEEQAKVLTEKELKGIVGGKDAEPEFEGMAFVEGKG